MFTHFKETDLLLMSRWMQKKYDRVGLTSDSFMIECMWNWDEPDID